MLAAVLSTFGSLYSYGPSSSSASSSHTWLYGFIPVILILAVVEIIAIWRVFEKAGRPGWAAIIPLYNNWVLLEISGKPGWWALFALLSFIPIVGWIPYFVLYIIAMLELTKRFGKSPVFAVFGLILFSFVGLFILGFGKAEYHDGPEAGSGPASPKATPPAAV
jgi:hypothetical protein